MKNQLLQIVTAITLLFSPFINFAQAPGLGAAGTFVLFSSNGAVTNAGIPHLTHLTGNVGRDIGSTTGFGNVNGVMHNHDTLTGHAVTDLLDAYNQLNTAIPTDSHAPLLGNGDTLKAGIYAISDNTTLSDTLFLNGEGNANAVFIFQISAALSTDDSTQIILLGNAQACNVFWKVEGLVSLGKATSMKGNIIANNAAINMATGVTLEGRALSTTGAITVDKVLAYIPTGCGSAILTGPDAPTLASAACYAIFSGNGFVTNAGISHVTGDVGTNSGLTVGYDSADVTGSIHPAPDMSTAACGTDLGNVYTYLNTLPDDIELLFPPQFGNSLVLTPHTYRMNSAVSLTDTLYLDAENNANAVFVIKINGALATNSHSKVLLINGTQPGNIFWKVDGAVSIGDSSDFAGTIVCNNAAVDLKTGVALNGRAFTTSGALTTAMVNVVTMPAGCTVLPVSLLYFRGKPGQDNVLLEWSSTNEINNGFFTIEKSRDGNRFETFAIVNAAGENGKAEYQYSITDQQPYSIGYYRISQTDKNGQKKYFRTIQVKININHGLKVFKYVQGNYIYVKASGAAPANGSIELYNIEGKKISSQKIILTRDVSEYKIEKQLQKGMYLLNIISQGGKLYYGKVMVL